MKKMDSKKKQRIMKYQPEIYFAGWRHNFPDNSNETMYRRQYKKNRYETEEIFRGWKRYLMNGCIISMENNAVSPRKEASKGVVAKENAQKIKIMQKKRKSNWNSL